MNTIRVYNIDPTVSHDVCASIFNAVGIYMIVDVNSPLSGESINRADPGSKSESRDNELLSCLFEANCSAFV